MSATNKFYKLWRMRKTIFEMCRDRGYKVSHFDLEEDLEEFTEYFGDRTFPDEDMNLLFSHTWDDSDKICVIFHGDGGEVVMDTVRKFVNDLLEVSAKKAIIVVPSTKDILPHTRKYLEELVPTYMFEVFIEPELLLNITQHVLNHEYTPLTPAEVDQVLAKQYAKSFQLPRILAIDPIAKYFGLKKGEILKIVRKNEKGDRYVVYKIVI